MNVLYSPGLQACASYEKVAEGFSRGLRHIGDEFQYIVSSQEQLPDTSIFRQTVAFAYTEVFRFLCSAMEWEASWIYRVMASLKNGFYEKHLKSHIDEIEHLARKVHRHIGLATQGDVADLRKTVLKYDTPAQQTMISNRYRKEDDAKKTEQFETASKNVLVGLGMKNCLVAAEKQFEHGQSFAQNSKSWSR